MMQEIYYTNAYMGLLKSYPGPIYCLLPRFLLKDQPDQETKVDKQIPTIPQITAECDVIVTSSPAQNLALDIGSLDGTSQGTRSRSASSRSVTFDEELRNEHSKELPSPSRLEIIVQC